jgi:hypothetical protein
VSLSREVKKLTKPNQSNCLISSTALALSLPFTPNKNYDDHRWTLVRDGEGKMHLLDLDPIDAEVEPAYNPEEDTFFLLFTRRNPTVGQRVTWSRESIDASNFRSGNQVRFLIHGWTSSSAGNENVLTTREFLEIGDHNVFGEA